MGGVVFLALPPRLRLRNLSTAREELRCGLWLQGDDGALLRLEMHALAVPLLLFCKSIPAGDVHNRTERRSLAGHMHV